MPNYYYCCCYYYYYNYAPIWKERENAIENKNTRKKEEEKKMKKINAKRIITDKNTIY